MSAQFAVNFVRGADFYLLKTGKHIKLGESQSVNAVNLHGIVCRYGLPSRGDTGRPVVAPYSPPLARSASPKAPLSSVERSFSNSGAIYFDNADNPVDAPGDTGSRAGASCAGLELLRQRDKCHGQYQAKSACAPSKRTFAPERTAASISKDIR